MWSLAFAMLAGVASFPPEIWPSNGIVTSRPLPADDASANPGRCYALMPKAGERVRIIVEGKSFLPNARIARGALCPPTSSLVEAVVSGPAHTATLDFVAAGGRYLLYVSGPAQGVFSARSEITGSAEAAAGRDAAPSTVPTAGPSSRRALMERQVAAYEAEKARAAEAARIAAEERKLAEERARIEQEIAAAEQRARQQQIAENQARADAYLAQTLMGVARQVGTAMGQSIAADAANERRLAELNLRQRQLQREAQQAAIDRAAAQRPPVSVPRQVGAGTAPPQAPSLTPQQIEARRAAEVIARRQAAAPTVPPVPPPPQRVATAAAQPPAVTRPPPAEIIAMLEGVVVCPLNPERGKLFGQSFCHGPVTNSMADHRNPNDIRYACDTDTLPRDLGMYGNNHVWGCNYGINPRKSGSPNIDQAARYGLIVASRRTYRCDAKIAGFCRS